MLQHRNSLTYFDDDDDEDGVGVFDLSSLPAIDQEQVKQRHLLGDAHVEFERNKRHTAVVARR